MEIRFEGFEEDLMGSPEKIYFLKVKEQVESYVSKSISLFDGYRINLDNSIESESLCKNYKMISLKSFKKVLEANIGILSARYPHLEFSYRCEVEAIFFECWLIAKKKTT